MARVHLELSDFAPLVQDVANRRRPLLATRVSQGPKLLQVHLDVTLHALEAIESDGPITVSSEFQPGDAWLNFAADVPRVKLKIPCTLKGGTLLIKDGDWPLEVDVECRIAGQIRLVGGHGEEALVTATPRHVDVAFKSFELRCPAFPKWFEIPMQRVLERMLEEIIAEAVPVELRRPFTAAHGESAAAQPVASEESAPAPEEARPAANRGIVYQSAFYLGYGLTFPALWIAASVFRSPAITDGLREGASSAAESARRIAGRWSFRRTPGPGREHEDRPAADPEQAEPCQLGPDARYLQLIDSHSIA